MSTRPVVAVVVLCAACSFDLDRLRHTDGGMDAGMDAGSDAGSDASRTDGGTDAGCELPTLDCNGVPEDGCETDVETSTDHCGACGTSCGRGEMCVVGRCVCGTTVAPSGGQACPEATVDDRSVCCDGLCQDTFVDGDNCGACGVVCGPNAQCDGGTCACSTTERWADCDADLAMSGGNGCEVDLGSSVTHCGTCGMDCATGVLHVEGVVCEDGTCDYTTCRPGFADCDEDATNGCEQDLINDEANCGACGVACEAGQTCSEGVCV